MTNQLSPHAPDSPDSSLHQRRGILQSSARKRASAVVSIPAAAIPRRPRARVSMAPPRGVRLSGLMVLPIVVSAAFFTTAARASEPVSSSSSSPSSRVEDLARARGSFARGLVYAKGEDAEGARRNFAAAYALVPSVDILWNLAMAERKVERHVDALQHFRAYVADRSGHADRRQLAETEIIPELLLATGRISIRAPEGAMVLVDGASLMNGATALVLEPGMHAITATLANGQKESRAINVLAATETIIDFVPRVAEAETEEEAPAPEATTPHSSPPTTNHDAAAATTTTTTNRPRTWAVLGLGGAAIVSAAGGIVFASIAASDRSQSELLYTKIRDGGENCAQAGSICADRDRASAAADRENAIATTLFVSSGVFAGAAIATWLLWPEHTAPARLSPSPTTITPIVGSQSAGLQWRTAF